MIRAISIQQPYAFAILRLGKGVENRHDRRGQEAARKAFNRPGLLLIHSSQRYAGADAYREVQNLAGVDLGAPGAPNSDPAWAFGALIGAVDLTGVHTSSACEDPATGHLCSPWAHHGAAHLQLSNPRVFTLPIEIPGRLGLWTVEDAHLVSAVRRQLA